MNQINRALAALAFVVVSFATVFAQTSAVNYQGELKESGIAAQGLYEMQFKLFDAVSGGSQVGSTLTNLSVSVSEGIFSVTLDFGGPAFSVGADRFLEISVRNPSGPPGFTLLSPRKPITSSPYSLRTVSASAADSLSAACVTCVTDANINSLSGTKVTGTVANATNATTAANVSGIVAITNGGTGSATKSFVDLSTNQTGIGGNKTFSGNVTIGGTLTAMLGQTATTVYGTSTMSPAAGFSLIPGLTQTINVPAGYTVYISAGGGLSTTSTLTTGFSRVDIALLIDGAFTAAGNYRRVIAANTGGNTSTIENWSMSSSANLSPGSHTIQVHAALNSGSAASVSGDASSVLQSELTVVLIKN